MSSCAGQKDTTLDLLLEREATAEDTLPEVVATRFTTPGAEVNVVEGTFRRVGEDSEGVTYYVGEHRGDGVCLVVYVDDAAWGSSCGPAGDFSMTVSGITAWLLKSSFRNVNATENVEDIVFLIR